MLRLIVLICLMNVAFLVDAAPNRQPQYDLLITGCPRSGTSFISKVLQRCGLDIKHERMGAHGTVNWIMAVPADFTPAAFDLNYCCVPGLNQYRFTHIFHQVRNPLRCIPSIAANMDKGWGFIEGYIQEVDHSHPIIINAARYWYYWNLKAEKLAEWTYRIENVDKVWDEFCRRLGYPLDKGNLKRIPHNTNTRNPVQRMTWQQLKNILEPELYNNIVKMAKRYGYATP